MANPFMHTRRSYNTIREAVSYLHACAEQRMQRSRPVPRIVDVYLDRATCAVNGCNE